MNKLWVLDYADVRQAAEKTGFLDGVEETLDFLKTQRDTLILFAKGDRMVIWGEIGLLELLNRWFRSIHIVEPHEDTAKKLAVYASNEWKAELSVSQTLIVSSCYDCYIKPARETGFDRAIWINVESLKNKRACGACVVPDVSKHSKQPKEVMPSHGLIVVQEMRAIMNLYESL